MIPARSNPRLLPLGVLACLIPAVGAAQTDGVRTLTAAECTVGNLADAIPPAHVCATVTGIGDPAEWRHR